MRIWERIDYWDPSFFNEKLYFAHILDSYLCSTFNPVLQENIYFTCIIVFNWLAGSLSELWSCSSGEKMRKNQNHTLNVVVFLFLSYLSFPSSLQTQLQGLQDHLAGVEQHGEFFCCYRKINISTFVTLSFEPLKNWDNSDQTTIVNSGTERPRCRGWACGWNWGELLRCYFVIGQTVFCWIAIDCA